MVSTIYRGMRDRTHTKVRLEKPARDSLTGESGTSFVIPPGDSRVLVGP